MRGGGFALLLKIGGLFLQLFGERPQGRMFVQLLTKRSQLFLKLLHMTQRFTGAYFFLFELGLHGAKLGRQCLLLLRFLLALGAQLLQLRSQPGNFGVLRGAAFGYLLQTVQLPQGRVALALKEGRPVVVFLDLALQGRSFLLELLPRGIRLPHHG